MSDKPYTGEDQIIIANMIGNYDATVLVLAYLAGQRRQRPPVGRTVARFRSRDLVSGGAIECSTREDAERYATLGAESDAASDATDYVIETAVRTAWPDGSFYTGPWTEVPDAVG